MDGWGSPGLTHLPFLASTVQCCCTFWLQDYCWVGCPAWQHENQVASLTLSGLTIPLSSQMPCPPPPAPSLFLLCSGCSQTHDPFAPGSPHGMMGLQVCVLLGAHPHSVPSLSSPLSLSKYLNRGFPSSRPMPPVCLNILSVSFISSACPDFLILFSPVFEGG